ncbi:MULTISPECIES: lactate oxidase [Stenotrophomonas]|uniref:lactate oxidase n=1 Tax=Stenotrophomonas TaxID=40323 RepID=UPI000B6D98A2|nr:MULTISPECIES: lactate oxidase [Stenotrophomonas]SMR83840.1 lactate oxidase [Stenotrophomonas sp. yr243]SNT66515.1 lactate oxidase [Stenotrophomonas lactitubi]
MTTRREVLVGTLAAAASASLLSHSPNALAAGAGAAAAAPSNAARYQAGTAERKLDIINLYDLEEDARKLIPKPQFGYISSGSGDEWTLRENVRAFDDVQILPHYLAGVDQPDISTTLLGSKVDTPIFIPPMAAHGLAHVNAEKDTAKGAADAGALFTAQTLANVSLADIGKASKGPKWFQLYYTKDQGVNRELIRQAKAMGATAIVFTVDLEWAGNREADRRNGFVFPSDLPFPNVPGAPKGATLAELFTVFKRNLTFEDLEFIARESGLPVVVKGIQSADNAREAIARGAAAIQVSNHGGRQLDTVPAAITSLPIVVEAVQGKVPVYLDGGIRRGVHVFKALAMGADAVAVGRPVLYGLALGGAAGVTSVLETLKTELRLAMKLAGTAKISDISRKYIAS